MKHFLLSVMLSLFMLLNGVAGVTDYIYLNSTEKCPPPTSIRTSTQVYELEPSKGEDLYDYECTLTFKSLHRRNICATIFSFNYKMLPVFCPFKINIYLEERKNPQRVFWCASLGQHKLHICSTGPTLSLQFVSMSNPYKKGFYLRMYQLTINVAEDANLIYGTPYTTTTTTTTTMSSRSSSEVDKAADSSQNALTMGTLVGIIIGCLVFLTCCVSVCLCYRRSRTNEFDGNTYQQQPLVFRNTGTPGQHPTAPPQPADGYPQPSGYHQPPQQFIPSKENPEADPPPAYEDVVKQPSPEPSAPPMNEKISNS